MRKHFAVRCALLFVLAAMFGLAGCATNTVVPLRYQASAPKAGQTCAQSFTVLPFADKRADTVSIGALSDGKRYYAENDPAEWIGWAVFEELKARGCDVRYREKPDGQPAKGFTVSGSFDKINVDRGSNLMVKADLRLNVRLEKDGQFVAEQVYSGSREDLGVSAVSAAQGVLSATLQYLLQDAAANVIQQAK